MGRQSLVSAIVPVYNGEQYLAETLSSILSQTYRPVEVIVIDDGSTDGSAAIARSFPDVRYYFQSNAGPGAARNHGVERGNGQFFAFLDADDLWEPEKLARQMAAFANNPELDMVFGYVQQFYSPELDAETKANLRLDGEKLSGYVAGAMLIKRDAVLRAGSFATHWRVGEFIDWYAKAKGRGLHSLLLPEVVLRRRIHTRNMGIREQSSWADYVRIVKASLDRRRKERL